MHDVQLKRGGRDIVLKKVADMFAVRLKQGRANDEKTLFTACGRPKSQLQHIDSAAPAKMDIFSVDKASDMETTVDELRKAPASDVVTHMYQLDNTPGSIVIPTGNMTIQFNANVKNDKREKILSDHGLEIIEQLNYLPHGYIVRLTQASKENPLKIAIKLQSMKEIKSAEPDLAFKVELKHIPTDDLYNLQWHLNNPGGQVGLKTGADVKAQAAWDITRGSRNITICVMDDGFDLGHPDFNAPGKLKTPRDFGQDDFLPNPVFEDDNHGTACAGVALAEDNGSGVVGLAPGCAFMPVRMGPWLTDQAVAALFQYAIDNKADVISCSWAASAWDFSLSTTISAIIHAAATQGRGNGKGCVILFAAGNEDRPLDGEKDGQRSYQGFALHPDVIAVAASNSLDQRSSYSNFGPEISICAPSSGSPGRRIVTTDRRGTKGYSSGDFTHDFGGTSSSTPLAAGLAALVLSVNPELTSAEVRSVMMETADKIQEDGGSYVNGHSPQFGHGRINAHAAVSMAAGVVNAPRLPEALFIEHRVNKPIPDLGQMEDAITFPVNVSIDQLEVSIDIQHTWRGDLQVKLFTPNNIELELVNRTGGSQDDIVMTIRSTDEPGLFADVIGSSAEGVWRLQITDAAKQDVGVLRKWGLAVSYRV